MGTLTAEKRKYKRYTAPKGMMVVVKPHYAKIGQLLNISMGGLLFQYISDGRHPNGSTDLNIWAGQKLHLANIPFHTIEDVEVADSFPLGSLCMRNCRIKFKALSPGQRFQLRRFIQSFSREQC